MTVRILQGDCRARMAELAECSVDAIVTDPPYGLGFMGKVWDHQVPGVEFWAAALRVAKPGAHLIAFGGTRTFHRLACAIEDAGWELRDTLGWLYGSGFPKSLDVSKAIDKAAGAQREVVGDKLDRPGYHLHGHAGGACYGGGIGSSTGETRLRAALITAPTTDAARQWEGWGTALKPAWEPAILARKPLDGTVAANVLEYGTGALNIDGCRVEAGGDYHELRVTQGGNHRHDVGLKDKTRHADFTPAAGRWPANILHDGSDEVLAAFPDSDGQQARARTDSAAQGNAVFGALRHVTNNPEPRGDAGSAARFFWSPKVSTAERNLGLGPNDQNRHPTVKPVDLMAYLCRLVCPPGGVILDPFMGSGSTGIAASREGFGFIGIDLDPEHCRIARLRITGDAPLLAKVAT